MIIISKNVSPFRHYMIGIWCVDGIHTVRIIHFKLCSIFQTKRGSSQFFHYSIMSYAAMGQLIVALPNSACFDIYLGPVQKRNKDSYVPGFFVPIQLLCWVPFKDVVGHLWMVLGKLAAICPVDASAVAVMSLKLPRTCPVISEMFKQLWVTSKE